MASVSEASEGRWAAREISQAEVPMRAMEAPMAPAPRSDASARRRRALRAIRGSGRCRRGCRSRRHLHRRGQLDDAVGQGGQRGAVGHDHRGAAH